MKLSEVLRKGEALLQNEDAKLEAWILFSEVFGLDRGRYFLQMQEEANETAADAYFDMVHRRQSGEPVAYIIGNWEFMGLPFQVSPAVLIPRPDTETLVEAVIEWVQKKKIKGKVN